MSGSGVCDKNITQNILYFIEFTKNGKGKWDFINNFYT